MSGEDLVIDIRGDVVWLTIDREQRRNAINDAVLKGISRGITTANAMPGIRAVVLTGRCDKAFCAGGDLQNADPFGVDFSRPHLPSADLFRQARASLVPLIARVNGACMAGGMGLMAMCHLAIADRGAKFGLPEVGVGVFPVQVVALLQTVVPRRRLMELCLLSRPLSAEDALAAGLVTCVADDLDQAVEATLETLRRMSPAAIRRGLYCLSEMEAMPFGQALSFAESQLPLFTLTEDAREGIAAFQEKRQPVWTGR